MANDTIWGGHPEVADNRQNWYQGKTHHFWSIGAIQIVPFSRPAALGLGSDLEKTRIWQFGCVFRVPTRDFEGKWSYCGDKQETITKGSKIFQKRVAKSSKTYAFLRSCPQIASLGHPLNEICYVYGMIDSESCYSYLSEESISVHLPRFCRERWR